MYESVADALAAHDFEKRSNLFDSLGRGFQQADQWVGNQFNRAGGYLHDSAQSPAARNLASWADMSQVNPSYRPWVNTIGGLGGAAVASNYMAPHSASYRAAVDAANLQREAAQFRTPFHRATAGVQARVGNWRAERELARQQQVAQRHAGQFRNAATGVAQIIGAPVGVASRMIQSARPGPPSFWAQQRQRLAGAGRGAGGLLAGAAGLGLAGAGAFGTSYMLSRRPRDPQHADFMDQYYY